MLKFKLIDKIIKEPLGGAHYDREVTYAHVKKEILTAFKKIQKQDPITRIDQRRDKFIAMGNIEE
jgi:acetyl-CoA carboxylase carboxyl transferase subunit alpha